MTQLHMRNDDQYRFLRWAAPRIGLPASHIWPSESEALAIFDGDKLRCVLVYNAFYAQSCHMHIASDGSSRWASRRTLKGIFGYPFIYKQQSRVVAQIAESNIPTLVAAIKMGFRIDGRQRAGAMDGSDAIQLTMLAHECPWIEAANPAPPDPEPIEED